MVTSYILYRKAKLIFLQFFPLSKWLTVGGKFNDCLPEQKPVVTPCLVRVDKLKGHEWKNKMTEKR